MTERVFTEEVLRRALASCYEPQGRRCRWCLERGGHLTICPTLRPERPASDTSVDRVPTEPQ